MLHLGCPHRCAVPRLVLDGEPGWGMKEREERVVKQEHHDEDANERTKARTTALQVRGRSASPHQIHQSRLVRIAPRVKGCLPGHFKKKNKGNLLNSAIAVGYISVQIGIIFQASLR